MKATELLRLVALNINQNKFKSVMTSIGIVVGAATIVLVLGIGRGGQMDVAEQFAKLNAGAIDVSYEYEGETADTRGGFSFGGIGQIFGNLFGGRMPGGGNFGGGAPGGNSGGEAAGGTFSGEMPGAENFSGEMPGGGNFSGEMPGDGNFSGEMPSGGAFTGRMPDAGEFNVEMPEGGFPGRRDDGGEKAETRPEEKSQDNEAGTERAEKAGGNEAGTERAEKAGGNEAGTERAEKAGDNDVENDTENDAEDETSMVDDRMNQEAIILSQSDVEDIELYVQGISGATISYSTKSSVEGANLTSAQTYTIAGVKESYETVSKLDLAQGSFLTEEDDETKSKVCVLGAAVAKELYGSGQEIVGSTLYIDERMYTVAGVLEQTSSVSAGISPDTAVFIPYETGIKYVTGQEISPVITVIAEDVNVLDTVIGQVRTVLEENYNNAQFTFEDSGSRMQAAQSSNRTLTLLLSAMAAIVFLVGGIGIMNVLFVSVKERTNEIGILKAIGTSRTSILIEFLIESAVISCIGGMLGVLISSVVVPIVEKFDVRIEVTVFACLAALGFAVLTGTIFGLYPAWKASRLEPVEALNEE